MISLQEPGKETDMKYATPEISVLGDVAEVVRFSTDKNPKTAEQIAPHLMAVSAAYDLDE